ncbi:TRAP transporter substrate-binding protein [Fulvimarina sp. 2208YS6-2-32]|uniref:TRAP transporter substrate-binding protein n=1 Tax=Fulvimarina uroteuthidis TaxID=3098149 RepID=A0ABU5I299_9HYPH|nr:TRAP transporter substrate-binding protein [Fulvimarina sp. 2208YS6-2-32]MDY8108939.1 TRAP transporter substrate-binding protein [Fulvimarina sp. 2208YS6-2-32]
MAFKLLLRTTLLAGAAAITLGTAANAADWRGWNIHPEGYPNTVALEKFAKDVTDRTEGRVTAQVYNNAVLGDQPDAIDQVRNGALDFANFNLGPMGEFVPSINVLSLPFLFTGVDQMHAVMDGEIGQRFSDDMSNEGIISLAWFDSGARSFYDTKKPIETPADLDGLKIRVMNNQLYVDMVDDMGGNATPMAYGEVYQSLKTGVLDGAENNFPSFESSNHYEVAKFYSLSEHLILPECVCISKTSWDSLTPQDQEIVRQAAVEAALEQRKLWAEQEKASRRKVEEAGVTINEIADKTPFQEKMKPVYDGFLEANPDLKPLVEEIQATEVAG